VHMIEITGKNRGQGAIYSNIGLIYIIKGDKLKGTEGLFFNPSVPFIYPLSNNTLVVFGVRVKTLYDD